MGATGTRCSACGSPELRLHLRVGGGAGPEGLIPTTDRFGTALSDIVRCRRCGHMQLEAMPSAEDLRESYAEAESADYVEEEAGQRLTARRILAAIERHHPPGRLLDLGCWVGFLLAEAEARGWDVAGIEPSEWASEYARGQLGLDVRTKDLLSADLEAGAYDAIFLGDVIEHLPSPAQALDRLRPALAPEGLLVLVLPDAGSRIARAMGRRWWSVIPTHVQYFTAESIRALLERRGFEVLETGTAPKAFAVAYYLSRIGGYSERLGAALVAGAERAAIADRIWAPDFHDRMLVIACPDQSSKRPPRTPPRTVA